MGKYLDIARKLEERKASSLGSHVENLGSTIPEPVVLGGWVDFTDHLTDTERQYFDDLVEIIQSPKFGLGQEAAEREAGEIIARNRQPLQIQQALQDYRRYGYIKIFSTVLGKAVYLVQNERVAKCVPDQDIAVFLESDLEAVKSLGKEETKVLLEARILFGGPIKKGHD